jgi:Carbohydrate esterase, sialic acid-specific acetylesterase
MQQQSFTLLWDNDCNFGVENGSHSSGEWRPLQCQYSPGLQRQLFGPEMGLAESLSRRVGEQRGERKEEEEGAKTHTRPMHFLKFAMGSTNLHCNWNPNNPDNDHPKPNQKAYFRRFIQFCRSALADDTTNDGAAHAAAPRKKKLVGMFWLQGEGDSTKAKEANSYLSNLQSFVDAVRHELDAPNLPIVVSPIVWKGKYAHVVNQALKDAGSGAVRNCICIDELDASKFGVQQSGDPSCVVPDHFTAEAILDIGRRMGESFPMEQIK